MSHLHLFELNIDFLFYIVNKDASFFSLFFAAVDFML